MDSPGMAIQELPKNAIRLIGSAQVITSVVSVVKELIENSLDAEATAVDIKLENYGFDKLEVRDNGLGIKQSDTASMGLPHHTSKLTDTADLESLSTYGFRGEALGSLCALSSVTITTKTTLDDISMTYELDHHGEIIEKKPSHLGQGTTVLVSQLFHNIPVRRQYYSSVKRRKEELKKVEDLVIAFSIIKHEIRFSLRQDRAIVWQKSGVSSLRHSLLKVFGSSALSLMIHKEFSQEHPQCLLELYVPRPDADCNLVSRVNADRCFIFINHRPVIHKEILKLLKRAYYEASGCEGNRWPIACVSLTVSPSAIDVNLEPNKTKVLLQDNSDLLSIIGRLLEEVYGTKEATVSTSDQTTTSKLECQVQGRNDEKVNEKQAVIPTDKECENVTADIKAQEQHLNVNDVGSPPTVAGSLLSSLVSDTNVTLQLSKPLHSSTMISSQEINFDILTDLNDICDEFDDANNKTGTMRSDTTSNMLRNDTSPTVSRVVDNLKNEIVLAENLSESILTGDLSITPPCMDSTILTPPRIYINQSDETNNWSRGNTVVTSAGKKVQPVQLLLPNAGFTSPRFTSPNFSERKYDFPTPESKLKQAANTPGQMTLHDITNAQRVKRPTTAFIFFSKEMRAQVVKENPRADFQTISKKIGERWKSLNPLDRQKYEKLMTKDVQRYREQIRNKDVGTETNGHKKRKVEQRITSFREVLKTQKQKKSALAARPTGPIDFSLSKLKNNLQDRTTTNSSAQDMSARLIGEVEHGGWWLCVEKNALMAVIPWRMHEMLIYTQLMENHAIPTSTLDEPVLLKQSTVGCKEWATLLTLNAEPSYESDATYMYITDPRLCNSGFRVRKTQDIDQKVEIIATASDIAMFGVNDLREILECTTENPLVSITDSRPVKVKQFLQGEAVRMSRPLSKRFSAEEVYDLMKSMQTISCGPLRECFHHRPFRHQMHELK